MWGVPLLAVALAVTHREAGGDQGLRAAFYTNAMLLEPTTVTDVRVTDGVLVPPHSSPLTAPHAGHTQGAAGREGGQTATWGMRWDGILSGADTGETITMAVNVTGGIRLWVHQWKVVESWDRGINSTLLTARWNFTWDSNVVYKVRVEYINPPNETPAALTLLWSRAGGPLEPIPAESLSATVPASELERQRMQAALGTGFATWWRPSATTHVHLPTGVGFELATLDTVANTTVTGGVVDRCTSDSDCTVLPGPHTYNGSYTMLTTRIRGPASAPTLSVVTESAHIDGAGGHAAVLLMTIDTHGSGGNAAGIQFNVSASFLFDCLVTGACGSVAVSVDGTDTIVAQPTGFPAVRGVWAAHQNGGHAAAPGTPDANGQACVIVAWDNSTTITAAASAVKTVGDCAAQVKLSRERVDTALTSQYGAVGTADRDTVDAMRSVVGWNTMWDPRIKVATPVSRSFGEEPFEMWLWDTYFCTLLASEDSKELAYSNLIEITRPTVRGNVPGFRAAPTTVSDRSKPYVGAFVLLEHYKKFGDVWIVELLYPSMLMWLKWIATKRVGDNGLVFLGSDNLPRTYSDGAQCKTIAAKWESGLDNSPMYDDLEIETAPLDQTCKLPIYDVGMTGLYLTMCTAMAELADIINKPDDVAYFQQLGNVTAKAANALMWNESAGIYQNLLFTGELSSRVSPFNFHMMMSGSATEAQATVMATKWLMSAEGFCLTDNATTTGSSPTTLPSNGILQLWYSKEQSDNAICSVGAGCPQTVNGSAGYVQVDDNQGRRAEGQAETSAVPGARELRRFYSAVNRDNMVGFDALDASYADIGTAGLWVHQTSASLPDGAWSLDIYWSKARKDYQNIANPVSRQYAGNYVKVAHLGWVLPTPNTPPPPSPSAMCKFGLPSIAASDPAYPGEYWRGRTWGPMNFLVWKGLAHPRYADIAEVREARGRLAATSQALLLQEWREHGHVHENYDAGSGVGDNVRNSNPFYTWGALLGFVALADKGLV